MTLCNEDKMKRIAVLILSLAIAGCSTFNTRSRTFEEHFDLTVVVDRNGAVTIGGVPTSLHELSTISDRPGLPAHPEVLIRGHFDAKYSDIRAVMDNLTRAGVRSIVYIGFGEEDKSQSNGLPGMR